jgi:hypothetical protein
MCAHARATAASRSPLTVGQLEDGSEASQTATESRRLADLRFIDFAHTDPVLQPEGAPVDEGLLLGVNTLITFLDGLVAREAVSPGTSPAPSPVPAPPSAGH